MGSTTPIYALPYPVGTDLIMDGDNAIEALARRVEALLGSSLGVPSGRRNVIRNGDMGVAQRGRTFAGTTNDRYLVDGWKAWATGGSHAVASNPTSIGASTGVDGAAWHLTSTVTGQAAAADVAQLYQRVEDVRTLAGKQVTVSFRAEGGSGASKIGVTIGQSFGTGGAPSAGVSTSLGSVVVGPGAQRYSVTGTIPSVAGKVLGTSGTDHVQVTLWLSAGTDNTAFAGVGIQNVTFNITDVQLEAGPLATPFERLSQQAQLAWCQRYYMCYEGASNAMAPVATYSSSAQAAISTPVQMRGTIVSITGASLYVRGNGADLGFAIAAGATGVIQGNSINVGANGGFTNASTGVLWCNSATGYLRLSAEL